MDAPFRASIVARARFIEDLVTERAAHGVRQYILLGAGLDTSAQRRADIASQLQVYEIDQPGPQAWKRERLAALGYGEPDGVRSSSGEGFLDRDHVPDRPGTGWDLALLTRERRVMRQTAGSSGLGESRLAFADRTPRMAHAMWNVAPTADLLNA